MQCFNACAIKVLVKNNLPVKIEGDPDNPVTKGKICGRGISGIMKFYDPHRVKTPLIRTNANKGPGIDPGWKEVSWDEAFEIVGERLRKIRNEEPNKLITGFWCYEKYMQANAWSQAFGTENAGFSFTGVSTQCANPIHTIGLIGRGALLEHVDFKYCNYLLVLGAGIGSDAFQNFVSSAREMADARERGMKLVVVDPRLSAGAAKADRWIPIRPATDLAFILGMINLLINEYNLYDSWFLRKYTNAPYLLGSDGYYIRDEKTGKPLVWNLETGVPEPHDVVSDREMALIGSYNVNGRKYQTAFQVLKEQVMQYSPQTVSKVTSISEDVIRTVAREFGEEAQIGQTIVLDGVEYPYRPVATVGYRGLQAHKNGGLATMALEILIMVVGCMEVPGGVLSKSTDRRWGDQPQRLKMGKDGLVAPSMRGWEISDKLTYPPKKLDLRDYYPVSFDMGHLTILSTIDPQKFGFEYDPEMLLLFRSNPFMTCADQSMVAEALRKLFVVDITIYLDETAEFADVILPESTYLERYNLINFSFEAVGLQVAQPVVNSSDTTKEGMDILTELSERGGFLYGPGGYNSLLNAILDLKEDYRLNLNSKYTWPEILDRMAKSRYGSQYGLDWFKEHGNNFRLMTPEEKYLRYREARIPLYYHSIKEVGDKIKRALDQQGIEEKLGLRLRPEEYVALPYWQQSPIHRHDPKYDLFCINHKQPLITFSDTATNPWLMELLERKKTELGILIHEDTGLKKGITTGDEICVESATGKIKGIAFLSQGVHPEVVVTAGAMGHWMDHSIAKGKGVSYNALLPINLENTNPLGGTLESTAKVRIYRLK